MKVRVRVRARVNIGWLVVLLEAPVELQVAGER